MIIYIVITNDQVSIVDAEVKVIVEKVEVYIGIES